MRCYKLEDFDDHDRKALNLPCEGCDDICDDCPNKQCLECDEPCDDCPNKEND